MRKKYQEYKPIPGLPERWRPYIHNPVYEISDEGRVRRKYKNGKIHLLEPMISGYKKTIGIGKGNKKVTITRAVYETWIGPIPEGYIVQHKDGFKNQFDMFGLYIIKEGDSKASMLANRNKFVVPNKKKVIDNKTGKVYESITACAKELFVDQRTIAHSCNGDFKEPRSGIDVSWYKEGEKNE